jgi:hypothetical protein
MTGSYSCGPLWPTRGGRTSGGVIGYELVHDRQGSWALFVFFSLNDVQIVTCDGGMVPSSLA